MRIEGCVGQTRVNKKGFTLPRTLPPSNSCVESEGACRQGFKIAEVKVTFSESESECHFGRGEDRTRSAEEQDVVKFPDSLGNLTRQDDTGWMQKDQG